MSINDQPTGAILVVDDNEVVRDFITEALNRIGICVFTAAGGREALAILDKYPDGFSLVLLDIVMPGLSGPDTLMRIRRHHTKIPVVFMTGYTGRFATIDLLALGAMDVLQKPFSVEELVRTVQRFTTANYSSKYDEPTPRVTAGSHT